MAALTLTPLGARDWVAGALAVTRREMRDTLRDWRIIAPIVVLTLFFPLLMNFTVGVMRNFLLRYGGQNLIIGERLIPFFLMIVGFFPISFSLVVALETFVGERERKSIEALLCTPLTNGQLYVGKMLAATLPPLGAAYLGIGVYLVGLYLFRGWSVPPLVLVQIVLLTTCEAVVMVSGAVVISSQTTSTRAANLLASFIIVPMALVVQAESASMFLADYAVLWGFALALIVVNLILVRMGIRLFNREELLGREFDNFNLRQRWRTLKQYFLSGTLAGPPRRFTLWRVYRHDVAAILGRSRYAVWTVLAATAIGVAVGLAYAATRSTSAGLAVAAGAGSGEAMPTFEFIIGRNLPVVLLTGILGVFTLGVVPTIVPLINSGLVAFVVAASSGLVGLDPLTVLVAGILPHGILEITAVWLASMLALRLGASVLSRGPNGRTDDSWLLALADYVKVLIFVVVPLLVLAAWVEANITPQLLAAALAR